MAGVAGPVLRFEPVAPPAPATATSDDVRIAVLDTTWTPTPEEAAAGRLISIRDAAAPILASVDLLAEATRLLDTWVASTSVIDDMTIEGTSIWYYVRLHDHGWLQRRILWVLVVDAVVRSARPSRIEVAAGADPVLVQVARLVAARDRIPLEAAPADEGHAPGGLGIDAGGASPPGPRSSSISLPARIARRVRNILGRPGPSNDPADVRAARRRLVSERLERLAAEPDHRLLVVLEHARQRVEMLQGPRDVNPYVSPIVERLRGGPLDPIEVELTAKVDDDVAWSRLVAPDGERLLPASVIWQGGGDPDDEDQSEAAAKDVEAIASRIAGSDAPLAVAGVDLGRLLAEHVAAQARSLLPRKRRAVERIGALIRRLHPAGILLADEYHRQDWLIAAAAEGVPVAAVQHGILYPAHNGYVHATRTPTLILPDRTYVFGRWERDVLVEHSVYRPDEVVVGGSPRLDLVRPAAVDRDAVRAELGVAPADRMVVVSGTDGSMQRQFHIPVALAMLFDRSLPGVHIVVKQHPGEADEGPYRAVVERAAAAHGHAAPPLTIVQKIDLYQLLAAADAHIGIYSTVLTEAVATATPNLMFAALATADLLGYVAAGVAVPVRSGADVLAALEAAHARAVDDTTRQAFLDLHFEPGSASQRIADDLVAWLVAVRPSRPTPAVVLRPAAPTDADVLLDWANDPATRAASRRHAAIEPADHARWLQRRLAAPDWARLWIGEADGQPIGIVRFERRTPTKLEVSITVAPTARGAGFARPLLDAGVAAAREAFGSVTILADILPGNEASLALFTGAGFTLIPSSALAPPDVAAVISLELQ